MFCVGLCAVCKHCVMLYGVLLEWCLSLLLLCMCVLCVIDCVMLQGLLLLSFRCVCLCVCSNVCASCVNYCVVASEFNVLFVCVCACVLLLSVFVSFI